MSWYLSLETVQVIGRWKNRSRERVPEFTRERDERLRILVNSCISKVDRKGSRGRGKSCEERSREQGRHAVSKIRRAVIMKIALKESKRGNIEAMRKRLKTVSQRRGVDKTKSFYSTLFNRAVWVEPPQTCKAYSIYGQMSPQYIVSSWGGEWNWRRRLRTPNFIEAVLAREEIMKFPV